MPNSGERKGLHNPVNVWSPFVILRRVPEVMELNEKVRSLENELTGTYKEYKVSSTQILELTKKLNDIEYERQQLQSQLAALKEYNEHNAEIINQKVLKNGEKKY